MDQAAIKIKSYHLLDVEALTEANNEISDHLRSMIQGTPGGFRFRSKTFDKKLQNLGESYFLTLKKSNRLLGTICLVNKHIHYRGSFISAWYLRYFHIKAPMRTAKVKQRKLKRDSFGASRILLSSVEKYLTNPEILLPKEKQSSKSLMFGFIIGDNLRSSKWGDEIGLHPYGCLKLFIFTRLNPKNYDWVTQISTKEIPVMKEKLKQYYSDYSLYGDQNIFFDNNYFVIHEEGDIVAGLQANPEEWEIINKPGISGFLVHKIMPHIHFVAKRINLKAFRFAAIEGIYCKRGYENRLTSLLETVCSKHKVYFAFCYTDQHSPVMGTLKQNVRQGLISRMIHTDPADIRIKFYNWNEAEKKEFTTKPFYISCFDST